MEQKREEQVESRILESVINLIEQHGLESLTTRAIAIQAKVNVAAINYYFRSKELLVRAALSLAWKNTLSDLLLIVENVELPPGDRLSAVVSFLLEGGLRFPRMTECIMKAPADYLAAGPSPISIITKSLRDAFPAAIRADDEDSAGKERRLAILLAGLFFPFTMPASVLENFSLNLNEEQARAAYVRSLINGFGAVN